MASFNSATETARQVLAALPQHDQERFEALTADAAYVRPIVVSHIGEDQPSVSQ